MKPFPCLLFVTLFFLISGLAFSQRVFFTVKYDGTSVVFSSSELRQHRDRSVDGIRMLMDDSIIYIQSTHRKGRLQGMYRRFYENGVMEQMGHFSNNIEVGKWYYWKEDGTLDRIVFYGNDSLRYESPYASNILNMEDSSGDYNDTTGRVRFEKIVHTIQLKYNDFTNISLNTHDVPVKKILDLLKSFQVNYSGNNAGDSDRVGMFQSWDFRFGENTIIEIVPKDYAFVSFDGVFYFDDRSFEKLMKARIDFIRIK